MIKPMTLTDCLYVFNNLREVDKREVLATQWEDDLGDLAERSFNCPGVNFTAFDKSNNPVAVLGVAIYNPGVGVAWMVATDHFKKVAIEVTRFSNESFKTLLQTELHRIQVHSAAFHTESHQWLKIFGFKKESTLKQYGRKGEDFYMFAMTRPAKWQGDS